MTMENLIQVLEEKEASRIKKLSEEWEKKRLENLNKGDQNSSGGMMGGAGGMMGGMGGMGGMMGGLGGLTGSGNSSGRMF